MYKVGIELEVKPVGSNNRQSVLDHLNNSGIPISWENYSFTEIENWVMKPDVSVYGGFELVSKPLTGYPEIEEEVTKLTSALKGMLRVDRDCGHHIHISLLEKYWARRRVDVSTRDGRLRAIRSKQVKIFCAKLLRNYAYFQSVIDSIVAPSRRVSGSEAYNRAISSEYANQTNESIEDYVSTISRVVLPRHSVINFESLIKYGTVEFRQFQGTMNKTKIMNWMKLCERFCARTSDRKYKNHSPLNYPKTIEGMCDFLGFGKYGVRRWAISRAISNGFQELAIERVPEVRNSVSSPRNSARMNNSHPSPVCSEPNCSNPLGNGAFLGYCENCIQSTPTHTSTEEAILVLENDFDYYHQLRNAITLYRHEDVQFSRLDLHDRVKIILTNHEDIILPTFSQDRIGQYIGIIIRHFLNHFCDLDNE